MRFFRDAKYDFLSMRKRAYVVSGAAIGLTLLGAIFFQLSTGSWLNYGVDFTGGTLVQIHFEQSTTVAEVRSVVSGVVPGDTDITRFGSDDEFLVRMPVYEEGQQELGAQLAQALDGRYGADGYSIVRTEAVGPKIGAELQEKALLAILMSFALTLIYLTFRFETRFGVAAVIATVHDILVALGFLVLFRMEVSLPTVAAVLTIIGYSLNDTIIVFDRIRENLKKSGRREDYKAIVNRSINEVLPRTVMTSGTTLAALLALFLLGGAIIRPFALILIIGILVGTYSSIFVASPALLEIERRWKRKEKRKAGQARPARAGAGV